MFGRYFPLNIDFKIRNKDYSLPILFYFLNILFCSMSYYLAFELLPVTINLRKPLCWHRLEVNRSKWPILQASLLTPGIFSSESRLLGITWVLFQCICVFTCVCFLMGGWGCNRDQEKVNYLLVLRCQQVSPGWAGSSGEKGKEVDGEKERVRRKKREIPR